MCPPAPTGVFCRIVRMHRPSVKAWGRTNQGQFQQWVLWVRLRRSPPPPPSPAWRMHRECTIARALPSSDARADHSGWIGHPPGLPPRPGRDTRPEFGSPQHPVRHVLALLEHTIARALRRPHTPPHVPGQFWHPWGTPGQRCGPPRCELGLPGQRIRIPVPWRGEARLRAIMHANERG